MLSLVGSRRPVPGSRVASEDTTEVSLYGSDFETQADRQLQGGGSQAGELSSEVTDPRFQVPPRRLLEEVPQPSRPKLLPGGLVAIPRQVSW